MQRRETNSGTPTIWLHQITVGKWETHM